MNIGSQFRFLHTLLPYLPAQSRIIFFFLLYFMEFQRMMDDFKRESDILSHSPPNPDFPDMDSLISMMTKNMPETDVERIKKMIDMMKMMEMMDGMGFGSECTGEAFKAGTNNKNQTPNDKNSTGFNTGMLKKMMSPKQQEMFEKYQDMFKYE